MIENTDFLLYGGVGVGIIAMIFITHRFFGKKKENQEEGAPKHEVMSKIQDFYSTQGK